MRTASFGGYQEITGIGFVFYVSEVCICFLETVPYHRLSPVGSAVSFVSFLTACFRQGSRYSSPGGHLDIGIFVSEPFYVYCSQAGFRKEIGYLPAMCSAPNK